MPPASPQESTAYWSGGGQLWTMDINSSFAGISLGRHMFPLHSPPEASSPQTLQAPGLVETSPSKRQGDWLFPQRTLDSCCSAAAPAGLTTQGLAAHHHGLANWQRQAPGPQRQSLWTVPKGWGFWVQLGHLSQLLCSSCQAS